VLKIFLGAHWVVTASAGECRGRGNRRVDHGPPPPLRVSPRMGLCRDRNGPARDEPGFPIISLKQMQIDSDGCGMRFERLRSISRRVTVAGWVTVMAFLALAEPAHAAFGPGIAATLFQAACAALVGCVFAARRSIERQACAAAAGYARWRSDREADSAVTLDGVRQARSQS